jgi:hypothetical protein
MAENSVQATGDLVCIFVDLRFRYFEILIGLGGSLDWVDK